MKHILRKLEKMKKCPIFFEWLDNNVLIIDIQNISLQATMEWTIDTIIPRSKELEWVMIGTKLFLSPQSFLLNMKLSMKRTYKCAEGNIIPIQFVCFEGNKWIPYYSAYKHMCLQLGQLNFSLWKRGRYKHMWLGPIIIIKHKFEICFSTIIRQNKTNICKLNL